MFDGETLSLGARAVVLACSSLGLPRGSELRPFGPRGWAKLAARLRDRGGVPDVLVGASRTDIEPLFEPGDAVSVDRLARLLERSGQLGFELERLAALGIWVRTIVDGDYPARLGERLGPEAPPVLFGAGEPTMLARGGVALVGSRDVDEVSLELTRRLAAAVVHGDEQVVSGGARGVDQVSMAAAFAAGGGVVGVLPEGVERRIREATTRTALADGTACVVSPWHPSAGFSAGAAMARNKVIYALSDVAVVISASLGTGGTWAGAIEALEGGWVPVLVRAGGAAGNTGLIERGACPIDLSVLPESINSREITSLAGPGMSRVAERRTPYEQQKLTLTD